MGVGLGYHIWFAEASQPKSAGLIEVVLRSVANYARKKGFEVTEVKDGDTPNMQEALRFVNGEPVDEEGETGELEMSTETRGIVVDVSSEAESVAIILRRYKSGWYGSGWSKLVSDDADFGDAEREIVLLLYQLVRYGARLQIQMS